MSQKPETQFRNSIHKYLPANVYQVKMNNPYVSGIPDDWYSGNKSDLWVEYKFIPKLTPKACLLPALSALQQKWINERYAEGRNVAVIVGCPQGGVVYRDLEWDVEQTKASFERRLLSRQEIAYFIAKLVSEVP